MEKLLRAVPNRSCGVVGVSSGGHPNVKVVVPDAPAEPSPAPPGPAIAPHHREGTWQPPHSPNKRREPMVGTPVQGGAGAVTPQSRWVLAAPRADGKMLALPGALHCNSQPAVICFSFLLVFFFLLCKLITIFIFHNSASKYQSQPTEMDLLQRKFRST